jgi:hypothetical protein
MKQSSRIIFLILISELIIGGGGRLVAFGPITLRMILFAIALIFTGVYFLQGRRMSTTITMFFITFLAMLCVGLAIGVLSGADSKFWAEDIKPLSYVLILPFFYFTLEDNGLEKTIAQLIMNGALLLSAVFFVILLIIHLQIVPFLSFYDLVIGTGEFFFRAETTFFYKGFIYLCIALIFAFFLKQHRYRYAIIFIFALAIILTFTRGFLFALGVTFIFYSLLERKFTHVAVGIVVTSLILYFSKPVIYTASAGIHQLKGLNENVPKDQLLGNRDKSDTGRIQQAKEVFASTTPMSIFFGHGFGIGVASRPVHMEISYLEIFHKQGILGLAIWAYLFYLLYTCFQASGKDEYSKAFYFSTCFLFFQSITNQFINNPIGLSFALLSLTYLHHARSSQLSNEDPKRNAARHQKSDEISVTSF